MKLLAGLVLAGAVAAVAAGVVPKGGGGPEPLAAEAPAEKPKFPIPVWHPDARWSAKQETFIGSGAFGQLDGPRLDIMYTGGMSTGRLWVGSMGGPYVCLSYDPDLERIHVAAGSARGFLDGPFSRARVTGGWAYMDGPYCASSPDGRYLFMVERKGPNVIRRLDLKEQQVVSIPRTKGWFRGLFADNKGKLYVVMHGGEVHVCDIDGKIEKTIKLQIPGGGSFLLDEVNDRLYWVTGHNPKTKWFVGYFDMKAGDGVFHGVLPADPGRNKKVWMRAVAAPFKDFGVYPQLWAWFGPDDPERNFIYFGATDTNNSFRMDIKKKEVWVCSQEAGGIRYISSGQGKGKTGGFNEFGDMMSSVAHWKGPRVLRYRRVK